jgi:hypothetical protein
MQAISNPYQISQLLSNPFNNHNNNGTFFAFVLLPIGNDMQNQGAVSESQATNHDSSKISFSCDLEIHSAN